MSEAIDHLEEPALAVVMLSRDAEVSLTIINALVDQWRIVA